MATAVSGLSEEAFKDMADELVMAGVEVIDDDDEIIEIED